MSASGTIRRVLYKRARSEAVFTFCDDLSIGPIADVYGSERKAWYVKHFAADMLDIDQLWKDQIKFWSETILTQGSLMVWLTRRSAAEYSGFLELLSRLPERSKICLADFTERKFNRGNANVEETCISIGYLNEESMDSGFQTQSIISTQDWLPHVQMRENLKHENAPLRIAENDKLFSKPEDYFDGFLFQHLSPNWQKRYRVAGEAVVSTWDHGHHVSFEWFYQRMKTLIESHILEVENGDAELEARVRTIDSNTA